MAERSANEILGLDPERDALWEVFHENSKNRRSVLGLSPRSRDEIQARMAELVECLCFPGHPTIPLPTPAALDVPLGAALLARRSTRDPTPGPVTLPQLAALLHYAYGMVRQNTFVPIPARTRAVPSAGALYPLEVYLHSARVEGVPAGLCHYSPKEDLLHVVREGDETRRLSDATLYPATVAGASVVLFVTALFERSTWKYGDRGYRYALIEAGHLAQNLSLVAAGLGLGCLSLGGYFDGEIDDLLGLDGVTQSTVQVICVGSTG